MTAFHLTIRPQRALALADHIETLQEMLADPAVINPSRAVIEAQLYGMVSVLSGYRAISNLEGEAKKYAHRLRQCGGGI